MVSDFKVIRIFYIKSLIYLFLNWYLVLICKKYIQYSTNVKVKKKMFGMCYPMWYCKLFDLIKNV